MVDEIGRGGEGGRAGADVGEGGDDNGEFLLSGERRSSRAVLDDLVANGGRRPRLSGGGGPPSQWVCGSRLRSRSLDS